MRHTIAAALTILVGVGTSANAAPLPNAKHLAETAASATKLVDWDDWHNRWRSHYRWGSHRAWGEGEGWHHRWHNHYRWGSHGEWGGSEGWHQRWRSHYRWGSNRGW